MGDMTAYFNEYSDNITKAMALVDRFKMQQAYNLISTRTHSPVFVFGNGGSAAIADHFCADYNKGVWLDTKMNTKAISLVSNIPVLTAIANDSNYAYIFSQQINAYNPNGNGLAIAISSSGNSNNILAGLEAAKRNKIMSIALVGFDGGAVLNQNMADCIIHVPFNNYGIVEDCHMIILHSIIQKLRIDNSIVGTPKL